MHVLRLPRNFLKRIKLSISLPDFKTYYKLTVFKQCIIGIRIDRSLNRIKSSEIDLQI